MLDKKIWLACQGIEPRPPEGTKTIRYLSLKIKTKNPGNFVTPTADIFLSSRKKQKMFSFVPILTSEYSEQFGDKCKNSLIIFWKF